MEVGSLRRPRRAGVLIALTGLLMIATPLPGRAQTTGDNSAGGGPSTLVQFDARGVASTGTFCVLFARAYPLRVCGGNLESTAVATSDPRGYSLAGLAPVPAAASIGLVIPNNDPITGTPVPDDVKEALKSFDFSNTPSQCQASYPPVKDGDDERTCGGPTAGDRNLGLLGSEINGHAKTSAAANDPFSTRSEATSRANEAEIPNLQAKMRSVRSFAQAGLNPDGRPQGFSEVNIADLLMFGNVVHLSGIRSTTAVASDGTEPGTTAVSTFGIASATVAGIGVVIGPDGVSVAGKPAGDPALVGQLTKQVNEALAKAGGVSLKMLPAPPVRNENGRVTAASGALEITYHPEPETEVLYRVGYTTAAVNSTSTAAEAAVPDVPASGAPPATPPATESAAPNDTTAAAGSASSPVSSGESSPATFAAASGGSFPTPPAANAPAGFEPAPTGGLTPEAAAGAARITGDPRLLHRPLLPAMSTTLPPSRLKLLFPGYAALVAAAAVLAKARRQLFRGRPSPQV